LTHCRRPAHSLPHSRPVPEAAQAPGGAAAKAGGGISRSQQTDSPLSEADQQKVRDLQQRDREVRAHEMAHVAAGGSLVRNGASFSYETGPDGQRYAIGGEVSIDSSPGRTPEETRSKAERIKSAALAPADPSAQDRQVAALATRMAMQASMEQAIQAGGAGGVAGNGTPASATPATRAHAGRICRNAAAAKASERLEGQRFRLSAGPRAMFFPTGGARKATTSRD
jgi:hypothetical protein